MLKKFLENLKMTAAIMLFLVFAFIIMCGGMLLFPNSIFIAISWLFIGVIVFMSIAFTMIEL